MTEVRVRKLEIGSPATEEQIEAIRKNPRAFAEAMGTALRLIDDYEANSGEWFAQAERDKAAAIAERDAARAELARAQAERDRLHGEIECRNEMRAQIRALTDEAEWLRERVADLVVRINDEHARYEASVPRAGPDGSFMCEDCRAKNLCKKCLYDEHASCSEEAVEEGGET